MTAIILGWNPDSWDRWNYPAAVDQVAATGLRVERWGVGQHRNIPAGADAWLVLQGGHAGGMIGHGVVVSEHPGPAPEQAETGTGELSVLVAFDALLPLGEQVPAAVLNEAVPGVPWDAVPGSGESLGPSDEAAIRAVWSDFGPPQGADPTQPVPGTYPEAAVTRVDANRYERSAEARRACMAHHGTSCAACGFSFEVAYGEIGKDFNHVHHLVPASQLGSGYQLDPVTDLVPLCANCHAMAHLGVGTPRTVAELRRIIGGAGFLRGGTVSPGELEAQQAARKMLGD
ncbi:HNH endonuclease [Arthrobacter sp. UYEF20]|uniref:HNH endonuclease n=1 Tax=Arthrobacter sp. UYEF20 TaxID=1756363 RepID=UPI003393787E